MKFQKISLFLVFIALSLVLTACPGTSATKPSITSFTAAPASITEGETAKLEWVVTGTTPVTLTINQDVGDVTGKSSVDVKPTQTTTYTLTAKNSAGEETKEVTVTVEPAGPTSLKVEGQVKDWKGGSDTVSAQIVDINFEPKGTIATGSISPSGEFSIELPVLSDDKLVNIFREFTSICEGGSVTITPQNTLGEFVFLETSNYSLQQLEDDEESVESVAYTFSLVVYLYVNQDTTITEKSNCESTFEDGDGNTITSRYQAEYSVTLEAGWNALVITSIYEETQPFVTTVTENVSTEGSSDIPWESFRLQSSLGTIELDVDLEAYERDEEFGFVLIPVGSDPIALSARRVNWNVLDAQESTEWFLQGGGELSATTGDSIIYTPPTELPDPEEQFIQVCAQVIIDVFVIRDCLEALLIDDEEGLELPELRAAPLPKAQQSGWSFGWLRR